MGVNSYTKRNLCKNCCLIGSFRLGSLDKMIFIVVLYSKFQNTFMFFFCLVFAMPLYVSVYMCLVVTCWEMADLLALVCDVLL